MAVASADVEPLVRADRALLAPAYTLGARELLDRIEHPSTASTGRGFALIDPSSRRRAWVLRTSVDGRRSPLPHIDYADTARRMAA